MTTASFLNALKRMMAHRGRVANVYSDNGTNFVEANRQLKELHHLVSSENKPFHEFLGNEEINWHFISPGSPHFGGIWEAGVKSVKGHLKRITGNAIFTYEEMQTLLTQIEAVLNSRPILPISNGPTAPTYLTPTHWYATNAAYRIKHLALKYKK